MSDNSESPPKVQLQNEPALESPPKVQPQNESDLVRDLVMWRRKQFNVVILLAATWAWTVMEIYNYNFITLLSWVAIALSICFFFWGNIHRVLKREAPDLSELEISEETAMKHASLFRQRAEEGIRLIFHVSTEREWSLFAGVVASLYSLSLIARHLDFLTLCYIGVVGGLTIPVIYVKNEQRIREFGENLRTRSLRVHAVMEDKFQKMKNKIAGRQKVIKEKKNE